MLHPRGGPRLAAGSVPGSNAHAEPARGRSWVLITSSNSNTV